MGRVPTVMAIADSDSAPARTASGVRRLPGNIGFISTGGTIASTATDEFDFKDYNAKDERVYGTDIFRETGLSKIFQGEKPDIKFVDFDPPIDSTAIKPKNWFEIAEHCNRLAKQNVRGIVIGHGTASLEETAWALSLVLGLRIPVVVTGCMRPLNGLSSEAGANLLAAFRVASHRFSESPGVLVVVNDEIHSPRTVTKTHTLRVGAFQSPWQGPIGYVDGDEVNMTFKRLNRTFLRFPPDLLNRLPRVDIVYSHVGADATIVEACVAAGAEGIVSAGFGPGLGTPAETSAFAVAIHPKDPKKKSVTVVQSSRLGAGTVVDSKKHQEIGIIAGNDLNPQKARILLALCLAKGYSHGMIKDVFSSI